MKLHRKLISILCFLAFASLNLSSAQAQQNSSPSNEAFTGSSMPKDLNTRAKLHTELGSLYFQNGNLIVALEELTIATSIHPDYAPAYSTRGIVLYYIKEYASAEKDFQRALSLAEMDPEINNNYGWFLCQIGKFRESVTYFERAIKNPLYQTPEVAYLNAGSCYVKIGELDTGEEYIRKSLRFTPENPPALFQLAIILYKRGNFDGAREHLKNVVRLSDPSAEVLWLFLRVDRHLGNRESESSLTAQLRRKYPDSPEYQELLKGNFE